MTAAASHDGVTSVPPCPGCVLCATLSTWLDSTPLIVPCAPPVAPVDLSELADDLRYIGQRLAARLVAEGRREYADTIAEGLSRDTDYRRILRAQVEAWGQGRDEAIVASNLARRRDDCAPCALAALEVGDADTRCNGCRAEVCA